MGGDKALEALPFHEVLDCRAGCAGIDDGLLPCAKGKPVDSSLESGLFLTLVAVATPNSPSRSFFLKFKTRVERNDMLCGLRKLLADIQIFEGEESAGGSNGLTSPFRNVSPATSLGLSKSFLKPKKGGAEAQIKAKKVYGSGGQKGAKTMVLLEDVHTQLSKERSNYERLMVQMLQSTFDLSEREDEVALLKKQLAEEQIAVTKRGRSQSEEHKVMMQLSRKLETLLVDNEDLREQNEKLMLELADEAEMRGIGKEKKEEEGEKPGQLIIN